MERPIESEPVSYSVSEQFPDTALGVSAKAAELLRQDFEQSAGRRPAADTAAGTHFVTFGDRASDPLSDNNQQLLDSAKVLEHNPAGKQRLRDMLDGKSGDDGTLAARHVLELMTSDDPQQSKDGERLLKLLLDKDREPIAIRLMSGLVLNPDHAHRFLDLMDNHADQPETRELLRLLQSNDSREHCAAMNLLALSAQKDHGATSVVGELVALLSNDKKRDDALIILSELGDAGQLRPMLQLMGNPESQAAASSLVDLLKTDNGATAVKRLLERSASDFGADRNQAQVVLGMLNDRGQVELAKRVLSLGLDQDRQDTLIDRLTKAPASGERSIVNILESRDPIARDAALKLLDSLASRDEPERARAEKLVGLLGDEKHPSVGPAILKNLNNNRLQDHLFEILAEPSLKEPAQHLLQMLAGDKRERDTATQLVSMWAYEKNDSRQAAVQLMQMLATTGKGTAETILRNLNGEEAGIVLSALNSPTSKGGATALLDMLSGHDFREQSMARSLLEMLRRERRPSFIDRKPESRDRSAEETVTDGQKLLHMLQDQQGKEIARAILSLPGLNQRSTVLELLEDKEHRAQANELLAWLKDPKMSGTARGILEQINRPAEVAAALKSFHRLSSQEDRAVMIQLAEGGGLRQLLSLLHSPEPSQQKAGTAILDRLKDPNQNWETRNLLKPDLPAGSLAFLITLSQSKDPATKSAADSMVTLLNTGADFPGSLTRETLAARRILDLMQSAQADQAKVGSQIFRLLSQPDGPALVVGLAERSSEFDAALGILNDPQLKRAAETFRAMVVSQADGEDTTWPLITHLVSSREPVMQQFGRRILEMLDDPQKESRAQSILTAFRTSPALDALGEVLSKPDTADAGKALMQMLTEGDSARITGIGNLFRALSPDLRLGIGARREQAAAGALIAMLNDPQEREVGKLILSRLPDEQAWPGMLAVLQDPVAKKAALEVLSSGDKQIHSGLTEVLAFSRDSGRLFTLLAGEKTAPLTRRVLPHMNAQSVGVLTELISRDSKHPALISLLEMLNQPESRDSAQVVLDRVGNTDTLLHVVGMLQDPARKPQAEAILRWLGDDNLDKVTAARNTLQLLNSGQGTVRAAGGVLLEALMSDDSLRQQTVQSFASQLAKEQLVTAARLIGDKRWSHAISRMHDIISQPFDPFDRGVDDRVAVVGTLLRLLGSREPEAVREGQRLLEMLHDPRYDDVAIREARRRYERPAGRGKRPS